MTDDDVRHQRKFVFLFYFWVKIQLKPFLGSAAILLLLLFNYEFHRKFCFNSMEDVDWDPPADRDI